MWWSTDPISLVSMGLLMSKIKYWLGWLLRPLCWSPEFWCASCGSCAKAMCSTRVRSLLTLVEHKTASQRRMQPSWRLEGAQMIMQLLLVVLCVGWVVLAMVFGILPFAPLIVGVMEALPGLALTSMLTEQFRNFRSCSVSMDVGFETWAKGWLWNRVPCKVPRRDPTIPSVFEPWLSGSIQRFQILWHAWMLKWKKMYWNVGWHMLRHNTGTVLRKVFAQTWAFLGWISLVSPMTAWGTLQSGARALLAKKRMSDLLQQQVSFQAMEQQQQFEWKKHIIYIYIICWLIWEPSGSK